MKVEIIEYTIYEMFFIAVEGVSMAVRGKSVYETIKKYLESHPGCMYEVQNFSEAGKEEALFVFWGERMPEREERDRTSGLLKLVCDYMEGLCACKKLMGFLKEEKLVKYYSSFVRMLSLYINENLVDREKLSEIGLEFCTRSSNDLKIKLGIGLLGMSGSPAAADVLKVLAMDSEYTFYVMEVMRNLPKYNSLIFQLAKAAGGYGRLHCLHSLAPINDDIKQWLIESGCQSAALTEVAALLCIEKADMSWYLKSREVGKREFQSVSRLLFCILSLDKDHINKLPDIPETIIIYTKYADKYAESFEDLCCTVYIEKLSEILKEAYYKRIKNKCAEILKASRWVSVLKEAAGRAHEATEYYVRCAEALDIRLHFDDFKAVLEKDPFDLDAFAYISSGGGEEDMKALVEYAKEKLPFDIIAKGVQNISDDELTEENKPDVCLLYILSSLKNYGFTEIFLPERSLLARLPECRKKALKYIEERKAFFGDNMDEMLKRAADTETDKYIKRRILKHIEGGGAKDKERGYTDISRQLVIQNVKDIYLFSSAVAGVLYKDITPVEEELSSGTMLYLKREPDNAWDENAIMAVTEEGYILGYIPRKLNEVPKNLLDHGKYLYAVIQEFSPEKNYISIKVYLSYRDVIEAVNDFYEMYTDDTDDYIQ